MTNARNRREGWLAAAFIGCFTLVLGASVYAHYRVFRYLEAKHCAGFWEVRHPGTPGWTKEWPAYCYPMGNDPVGYAGLPAMVLAMALMTAGGAITEVILAYREKRRVKLTVVGALLGIACVLLLVWKSSFFSTTL